ncbi:sigma-54-dependent Fis family transcriptional regulator [Glaciimonas immobilis]|uniref:Transcriptional regulator of acetoin/glycerol metabolism n=1 Tax=Glaciimonas immobilis TaxID=728004 RepID=A0A840RU44_9BURK|nr:sigma-54-dependent Fis family transcriptional regulator [Glaciimonas immobilis]KAF3997625.1 sigma-54-dependent Fis family transcriptional regulator [Glaciimonas immobilis]MBB5200672.1 transcriptional regulator of acetoin/glycerol metabolism [Glaciimonas immobilis]
MPQVMLTSAAVTQARQLFFEEGTLPNGLVHDAVWRSWQRCLGDGRKAGEVMAFNPIRRNSVAGLLERNRQLIIASEPAILLLAKAMTCTGYGILLTDRDGVCLAVSGPIEHCGNMLRQALCPGVDLSERAIGTNAMATAMAEGLPIGIFGGEHFFAQNETFQCVAAPIFDPHGTLVGSIDITRDAPGAQFGALSLMLDCAAAIETSLFLQSPAHITIGLNWRADANDKFSVVIVAFGKDGEVQAINRAARRFLGIGATVSGLRYQDLFQGNFAGLMDAIKTARHPIPLTLQSGLCLFAQPLFLKPHETVTVRSSAANAPLKQTVMPAFGDAAIQLSLHRSIRALSAGLPILIQGETGTGKEVAARALHANSAGCKGPFIAINCGAIPRDLIEGELFGYADGAYTGARRGGAKGKIEDANGGTLFLDEIGDMPIDLQTRLLRVLESREVTRLGESTLRKLDIQLISATHQDLDTLVLEKRFRSDLYFRLNGMMLYLPPLRLRSDLSTLIDALLSEEGIDPARLAVDKRLTLESYPWPGNTRELRTALRFAQVMADDLAPILLCHLPDAVRGLKSAPSLLPASSQQLQGEIVAVKPLKELASEVITSALYESKGNITCAALQLGISRATLHRWLNKN